MKLKFMFKQIRRKNQLMKYAKDRFDKLEYEWLKDASVNFKFVHSDYFYSVEATLQSHGRYFKAESSNESYFTAIDEVCEKLEKQCLKRIHKNKDHRNHSHSREGHIDRLSPELEYDYYKNYKKAA